jgi:hypothetical protein
VIARRIALTAGIFGATGLAAAPSTLSIVNVGSEATWTFVTGGILLVLAVVARRVRDSREAETAGVASRIRIPSTGSATPAIG